MKTSKLIKRLQENLERNGDLEVIMQATLGNETFESTVETVTTWKSDTFKKEVLAIDWRT